MELPSALRIAHPEVLLALPLVLLLVLAVPRARLRALPRPQRATVLALRVAIMVLLIAALAAPTLAFSRAARSVVFAIDVSDSMSPEQQAAARAWVEDARAALGPESETAVVAFGRHAQLAATDGSAVPPPDGSATNLADALRLAQAAQPPDRDEDLNVVVLTDGWENSGQAVDEVRPGMVLSYVAASPPDRPEVAITAFDVPPSVRSGDTLDLTVTVQSREPMSAELRLTVDGQPVASQVVTLEAGPNRLATGLRLRTAGVHDVQAEIVPERDTRTDDNSMTGVTVVKEAGRVLLLEGLPGSAASLATALEADGMQVETRPAAALPPDAAALGRFDGAVLVDTAATSLTLDQQKTLQVFVQEMGRGLLVVGGPHSFGDGGYVGTVLDQMLPVSSQPPKRPQRPNVALFLVIDRSGSMGETIGSRGPSKLAMAREAATRAIGMLRLDDVVGVLAFDDDHQWIVPPTRLSSQDDIQQAQARVAGLESGGGTGILAPLLAAYEAAAETSAAVKQLVLLTDGQSSDTGYEALLQEMQPERITLSTVAIGSDADTTLLRRLAERGQGRYYFTERSAAIPEIASKETSILLDAPKVEGDTAAVPQDASPLLRDLASELPPLHGYEATTPRDRAVTALVTAQGDPLLAHWQYGLGRVVAWTSDAGSDGWADGWLAPGWSDGAQFWPGLVRWSLPAPHAPGFQVAAELAPDGTQVTLRADSIRDDGTFANLLDTRATVLLPDGTAREIVLPQVAPGRYERTVTVDQPGAYHILFQQRDGEEIVREDTVGVAVPSPGPEGRTVGVNYPLLSLLAAQTGGGELRLPADLLQKPGAAEVERHIPLWPWLVGLAALLLPLDVAARRLSWRFPGRRAGAQPARSAGEDADSREREAAD